MCSACDTNTEQTNSITLTIQSRNGNLQTGWQPNFGLPAAAAAAENACRFTKLAHHSDDSG
jgi:hypothetical protein